MIKMAILIRSQGIDLISEIIPEIWLFTEKFKMAAATMIISLE